MITFYGETEEFVTHTVLIFAFLAYETLRRCCVCNILDFHKFKIAQLFNKIKVRAKALTFFNFRIRAQRPNV